MTLALHSFMDATTSQQLVYILLCISGPLVTILGELLHEAAENLSVLNLTSMPYTDMLQFLPCKN